MDSPDEVTGQGPLAEVTQGVCAGLPRPGRRIRCLHFGQELKTPVDGNVPLSPRTGMPGGAGMEQRYSPKTLAGLEPPTVGAASPHGSQALSHRRTRPFSGGEGRLQRGWLRAGGHFQPPGTAPRALGLCHHPLFSHASARIPVTISNLSPPILRPRPRPLPTRAATQRFTLLISRLLVN